MGAANTSFGVVGFQCGAQRRSYELDLRNLAIRLFRRVARMPFAPFVDKLFPFDGFGEDLDYAVPDGLGNIATLANR